MQADLMATLTMDEIVGLINASVVAAVQGALAAAGPAAKGGGKGEEEKHGGGRLDERYFRRVDKLEGKNWKEFHFQFMSAIGAANSRVREAVQEVIKAGKELDCDIAFTTIKGWTSEDTDKYGAELYAVLTSVVTGDAMTVVRGVVDGNGWEVWSRSFNRFDPRTPAKTLMAMMSVMQPKKAKDVRDLMNVVQAWEVNVRNLSIEHGITIDAKVKVPLPTSTLPSDLQYFVFQVADDKLDFASVRDRVMSLAVNRAAAGRPTPMEVDRVWAEEWPEEGAEGHQCWPCEDEEQLEVNYIGEALRQGVSDAQGQREGRRRRKGRKREREIQREGGRKGHEGKRERSRIRRRVLALRREGPSSH